MIDDVQPRSIRPNAGAYVDTCVISARIEDQFPSEMVAFDAILSAYKNRSIDLVRSNIVDEEIGAIPAKYRAPHSELICTLLSIPVATAGARTRMGLSGFAQANPKRQLWQRLNAAVSGEADREHIFTAACSRLNFFITVDRRTILSHAEQILKASGVHVLLPTQLVARALPELNG